MKEVGCKDEYPHLPTDEAVTKANSTLRRVQRIQRVSIKDLTGKQESKFVSKNW